MPPAGKKGTSAPKPGVAKKHPARRKPAPRKATPRKAIPRTTTPPKAIPDDPSLLSLMTELAGSVLRLAAQGGGVPLKIGRAALARSARRGRVMEETGHYLRELRELAGLTVDELSSAIDLKDKSLLEAVEDGTATLSFELILRVAALVARHDPVPFVLRVTRTYNPRLWGILEGWGIGRLPLQFEREREFVNIYRQRDEARRLSDAEFKQVLDFTRAAFDSSLGLVEALHEQRLCDENGGSHRGESRNGRSKNDDEEGA